MTTSTIDAAAAAEEPPLAPSLLAAYALSAVPLSMLAVGFFIILPTVYAETIGLPMAALGLIIPLTRIWDVVTDPLVGWLSDRTNTRWGRRRPWVFIAWVPLAISIWALYLPPPDATLTYLFLWSIVFFTSGTALFMPYTVWGAELSTEYDQRSRVFAYRHAFTAIGTLVAAALAWVARDVTNDEIGAPALQLIAWVGLALLPVTLLVLALLVPEPPVTLRPRRSVKWRESLKVLATNRPFWFVIAAYFLNGMANAFPATLFFFFVRHVLVDPPSTGLLLTLYFAAAIAGTPVWLGLSARVGKHRAWCVAMILAAATFVFVPFLGPGDTVLFAVIIIVAGLSLGGDLTLPGAMLADVVDHDTAQTGQRRAGVFYALWAMVAKLALAASFGISFEILSVAGFSAEIDTNTPASLLTLAILFGVVPVAFKVVAGIVVWRYPLTRERQAQLRRDIDAAGT